MFALAVSAPNVKLMLTLALVGSEILALALWTWADQDPTPS
jgi:hypothetical protein